MKPRKATAPKSAESRSRKSAKNSKKQSKKVIRKPRFNVREIPRSKLDRALQYLEEKPEPPPDYSTYFPMCFGRLANRVSVGLSMLDNYIKDTVNVMEVARHCAEQGRWADLMKTVAIMCEEPRHYDAHAILRNALFAIVADPALNDPSFLEAYLYSNPICTNPGDVSYCIDKILEVFQGISIKPYLRRPKENISEEPTTEETHSSEDDSDSE